jgi:hypothetical protein
LKKLKTCLRNPKFILGIYIAVAVIASITSILKPDRELGGNLHKDYNNYLIIKHSFSHLIGNKDLYIAYPMEHWDLYKYSPAFAMFMGLFYYFPDFIGLILWNLLNSILLFYSIKLLPVDNLRAKLLMLSFILLELLNSMQNFQSNGLVTGLIIFSFVFFEKRNVVLASLFIMLSVYVKLFGIVAFALFLLYPDKLKFILFSIFWFFVLALLPLLAVSPEQLQYLYISWQNLLANDYSTSQGLSVMGWLNSWFGVSLPKYYVILGGAFLFCIPLINFDSYKKPAFRLLFLSSILIWVIIFNHRAELPTFIIAISGVAIWYFIQERKLENLILIIFAFIFTSLSPTDLFPTHLRDNFVKPYLLKAVPSILIWFKLTYELTFNQYTPIEEAK